MQHNPLNSHVVTTQTTAISVRTSNVYENHYVSLTSYMMSLDSSVSIVTRVRAIMPKKRGSNAARGKICQMFEVSSSDLGHIQLRIQLVYGVLSPGVKRPGREINHSSLSRNNDKIEWSCVSTHPYARIEWLMVT
jgi:hypothetical protein